MKILLALDFFTFSVEVVPWHVPGTPEEQLAVAADVFRTITAYPDSASDLSTWGAPLA